MAMTVAVQALLALTARSGRILRVDLRDGSVETVTGDAGPVPDGILVDGGEIYWTTMGRPEVHGPTEADRWYHRRDGGVHAIGLDGRGRRAVLAPGTITTGKQLATDRAGVLYWGDREGCRVSCARTDGSGFTDLVIRIPDDTGDAECVGVAVDPVRRWLYWTQKGPAKGGQGRIFRAGLDLPAGESPDARSDIELLWDGRPEPIDLHLAGGWMYWTDRGAPPDGNTLNRAPVPPPGERGAAPQILARGFAEAIGLTIDAASAVAYVSDLGGEIRAVPLPGAASGAASEPTAERAILALGEPITGIVGV
jgi:hypothetical protein